MSLEFSEYKYAKTRYGAMPQLSQGGEIANQVVAIAGASAQSAAFNARTDMIVITKIDADARIAIGANPVAVSAGVNQTRFVKAGSEYAFHVEPGQMLAVITA
jgi:hypothetical protein